MVSSIARYAAFIAACCVFVQATSAPCERPIYRCHRMQGAVVIDGRLDEACWKSLPAMPFREIEKGTEPPLATITKVGWDDRALYVGMIVSDPDVWSRVGLRDNENSPEYVAKVAIHQGNENPEWRRLECDIMSLDKFVKVFIDPDADGLGYFEFHVNPINNIFDSWYDQGFRLKWADQERGPHVVWSCPGFVSATQIDGTLNAPHDTDRGWTVEMAIPWEAFAPQVKGACPPKPGDTWSAHLGRVHKEKFRSKNIYWTWPVIGVVNCHLPHTYGLVVFDGEAVRR